VVVTEVARCLKARAIQQGARAVPLVWNPALCACKKIGVFDVGLEVDGDQWMFGKLVVRTSAQ